MSAKTTMKRPCLRIWPTSSGGCSSSAVKKIARSGQNAAPKALPLPRRGASSSAAVQSPCRRILITPSSFGKKATSTPPRQHGYAACRVQPFAIRRIAGLLMAMREKRIGVSILNYNNWEDTIGCVESVIAGSRLPDWLIIVDNCSSNDSVHTSPDGQQKTGHMTLNGK